MQFRLQQNQCVFILNAQPHADDITSTRQRIFRSLFYDPLISKDLRRGRWNEYSLSGDNCLVDSSQKGESVVQIWCI